MPDLTIEERRELWDNAAEVADYAAGQIRAWSVTSPGAAADAAYAAGDALRATAAALGSRVLRQAADGFERAARAQYGRIPERTPVGNRLRQAARLISAYGYVSQDRTFAPLLLIVRLAALAEAVAELRDAQQRAHQAQAALRAAGHLRSIRPARKGPSGEAATPAPQERQSPGSNASRVAAASFPDPPFAPGRPPPAGPQQPASTPRPQPRRPPPRSPTR